MSTSYTTVLAATARVDLPMAEQAASIAPSRRALAACKFDFVRPDSSPQELLDRVASSGTLSNASRIPRVLVVLVGLLRQHEAGWMAMRRQLVEPNPEYAFDIVLCTDRSIRCTARDPGCECMPPRLPSPEALAKHYQGPRTRMLDIVWSTRPRSPPPWNQQHTHWSRLSEAWNEVLAPLVATRLHRHLLVARPDALLSRPLHLTTTCARHPDFSLISGGGSGRLADWSLPQRLLLPRPGGVHNHQWDFGSLSCGRPALLGLWLAPWKSGCSNNVTCGSLLGSGALAGSGMQCPVRAPVEFGGSPTFGCGDPFCLATALFHAATARIGTLDSSHISLELLRAGGAWCNRSRAIPVRGLYPKNTVHNTSVWLVDNALGLPCCETPSVFEMNCWPWKRRAHVCWWVLAGVVVLLSTALVLLHRASVQMRARLN